MREELREGSGLFSILAFMPAQASFGLADDLRRRTSGGASAALMLSHWERLQVRHHVPLKSDRLWLSNRMLAHARQRLCLCDAVPWESARHAACCIACGRNPSGSIAVHPVPTMARELTHVECTDPCS